GNNDPVARDASAWGIGITCEVRYLHIRDGKDPVAQNRNPISASAGFKDRNVDAAAEYLLAGLELPLSCACCQISPSQNVNRAVWRQTHHIVVKIHLRGTVQGTAQRTRRAVDSVELSSGIGRNPHLIGKLSLGGCIQTQCPANSGNEGAGRFPDV